MAAAFFAFAVVSALLLSGTLLYRYGNWFSQRLVVTVAVLIAWYFSFLIVFVLPLDVSSTAYRHCVTAAASASNFSAAAAANSTEKPPPPPTEVEECRRPHGLMPPDVLPNLWRVVYWSSQFLTWLVLPVMQSFCQAGEFTFGGKLRSALWDNAVFYSSYLLVALVLLVYIALQPGLHLTWERTKAIAAAASNTWGLFVLVLMLGYGLVEVPRTMHDRSKRGLQLNRGYFKIAKLSSEKSDAEETLHDVLVAVHVASEEIGPSDARRPLVETILAKVPLELMEKVERRIRRRGTAADPADDAWTEKSLARLHRQAIRAVQEQRRTEAQWSDWTDDVVELEDVDRNVAANERRFVPSKGRPAGSYSPVVEWYWKCLVRPVALRVGAFVAAAMSAAVIWSEVTFFSIRPTLSIFALMVSSAGNGHNYLLMEAISLITVSYLCLCAYYTVFRLRVLNFYYLAPNHHSDERTLLFSGALLSRLTPPLCLNFLSLVHMDSHVIRSQVSETAYTQIMGHMDVVSIVSDYFNIYFPMALLILAVATYYSVGARLLSALGFQQFLTQDSEMTLELVDEGKEHIKREKRRRQRLEESAASRKRFGDVESRGSSSDVRQRAADILKSRADASTAAATSHEMSFAGGVEPAGGGDDGQLQSPLSLHRPAAAVREPPRNIFDDL